MKSNAFGRLLAGPIGSGKTTGCIFELLRRAIEQAPGENGTRNTKFAVVRQTLRQLKDTVLKDCQSWMTGLGEWKVSESTFHLNFADVRSTWTFIPLEDSDDQARLLSMQLTGGWMSELIEMDVSILGPLSGRCGRYPFGKDGSPSWSGLIADTNMPTEMTPWHDFMLGPPKDWQVFRQPSGLSEGAENLNWLLQTDVTRKLPIDHPVRVAQGRKYYDRLVDMYGLESDWIKRYVKAEFGDDPSGQAVFQKSFKSAFHVVDETLTVPGYPLLIGQDFGRNPWSLICQADQMGRIVVHEEVAAENVGLEKHVFESLRPVLMKDSYLGLKIACVGDPAGNAKSTITEETSFDTLHRLGLPCFPAPTNDLDPRLRAVETYLGRQINGGPALLINREGCPHLVRALSGGYRFEKMKSGILKPTPKKDEFSHVADTLQYVCLVAHGGLVHEIAQRLTPQRVTKRPLMPAGAWT